MADRSQISIEAFGAPLLARNANRGFRRHVLRLIQYRSLLWNLASSELKAKHRQTALGMIWALLQPVSLMAVYTLVFSTIVNVPVQQVPYTLFAYVGLVSWLFFAASLSAGTLSVVAQMNLITKASFPREVIPLSKLIASGFDFMIGWGCLLLLLVLYRTPITPAWLIIPGVFVLQVLFTAGMVLWGSALHVRRRDVGSVLPLVLQIWMFLSPVIYPSNVIPADYRALYLLNPMAAIIEAYRAALFDGTVPSLAVMVPAALLAATAFATGYAYFKCSEMRFADLM
jgi:lipopolysaccharide transport system permease protein